MLATTALFALAWLLQRPGYDDGEVRTGALVAGLAAGALLVAGGIVGGANVFVYGIRVLKRPDTPPAKALNPFGVESVPPRGSDRREDMPSPSGQEPPRP